MSHESNLIDLKQGDFAIILNDSGFTHHVILTGQLMHQVRALGS
ncbi:hypothetical protein [Levilactobacillus brevis]